MRWRRWRLQQHASSHFPQAIPFTPHLRTLIGVSGSPSPQFSASVFRLQMASIKERAGLPEANTVLVTDIPAGDSLGARRQQERATGGRKDQAKAETSHRSSRIAVAPGVAHSTIACSSAVGPVCFDCC